jgi:glycine hydroxymethyltransferase
MHQIAAKAISFKEALDPSFKTYAAQVVKNTRAMADVFTAGGARLITGGTDNHLILADVYTSFGVSGGEAEALLDSAGITLNKNSIADDTRKPMDPSGIRFGTPALTTRGMDEKDCAVIAGWMLEILKSGPAARQSTAARIREDVRALAASHQVPDSFV